MTSTPPRVQPTPVTPDVEGDDLRAVASIELQRADGAADTDHVGDGGSRRPESDRPEERGDDDPRPRRAPPPHAWEDRPASYESQCAKEQAMIVTTMNDIPGYEVDEVFGEVMGLTVRSRNVGSQIGAGLKSILGGELKGMTKALIDSRQQVRERMVEEAEALGANAIIAMRFDTSEMGGNWTEICAYGTAVKVHKAA